jgi:cytochrome c oxidase subunit 2
MINRWLPPQASAHAADIDFVLVLVHWLMLVLFAGWGAYFVWALVRFRERRNPAPDAQGPRGRPALWTEIAVVIAEGALLVVIALPIWFRQTSAPSTVDPATVVVRVVAEQFAWNIHYPGADGRFGETALALVSPTNPLGLDRASPGGADDLVTLDDLHLPIGRPVEVQLSSKDVIHSFGVAAMRVKQDAIPGLRSSVWFTPTLAGQFDIACSQLCGLGHYRMRGIITVESDAEYRAFLAAEAALLVGR